MYRLDLVSAPATEPVTVAEAKTQLRIDTNNDDAYLATLITTARETAESYSGRAFITQTWKMWMDCWPDIDPNHYGTAYYINMPKSPLQSVTHIKTYSSDDTATTFSIDNYRVSTYSGLFSKPGRISLINGNVWPAYTRDTDGIEIEFVCGYSSNESDIAQTIKNAILLEVAARYENRGDCGCDVNGFYSKDSKSMLFKLKTRWF